MLRLCPFLCSRFGSTTARLFALVIALATLIGLLGLGLGCIAVKTWQFKTREEAERKQKAAAEEEAAKLEPKSPGSRGTPTQQGPDESLDPPCGEW